MSKLLLDEIELVHELRDTGGYRSSLYLRHRWDGRNLGLDDASPLLRCVSEALGRDLVDTSQIDRSEVAGAAIAAGADLESVRTYVTVAEVAVPGFAVSPDEVERALDVALDHVRFVQRVAAQASGFAVRLATRSTLPLLIPVVGGELADEAGAYTPRMGPLTMHAIQRTRPPSAAGLLPDPVDTAVLQEVGDAVNGVYGPFIDLRREAQVQRQIDGNARLAILALAAAYEHFLDTVLLSMLWEEHKAPEAAAQAFVRTDSHLTRMRKHLQPRLRGKWQRQGTHAIARYESEVVELRNRVIHGAYSPTDAEMDAAWSAAVALERFVGDQLAGSQALKNYTATASQWLGQEGLKRRGALTKHAVRAMDDRSEPQWSETFSRWREFVFRELSLDPPSPGAEDHEISVIGVATERTSEVEWALVDVKTRHAAFVDFELLRADPRLAEVAELLKASPERPASGLVALRDSVPHGLTWRPEHEILGHLAVFPVRQADPPSPDTISVAASG